MDLTKVYKVIESTDLCPSGRNDARKIVNAVFEALGHKPTGPKKGQVWIYNGEPRLLVEFGGGGGLSSYALDGRCAMAQVEDDYILTHYTFAAESLEEWMKDKSCQMKF